MTGRLLAFAQLVRLPNVFTAFSDILVGACAAYAFAESFGAALPLLLLASGLLYLSGMAWNDYFDRVEDAKTRPNRPIPSGRISPALARIVGALLMLCGVGFAWFATNPTDYSSAFYTPRSISIVLAVAILLYDRILKRTPIGPIGMGSCRFLNLLLGFSLTPVTLNQNYALLIASVVGLYIVGVTWFARTEEGTSRSSHLMGASGVMAAALLLALVLPTCFPLGTVTPFYPYLLIAFGVWIGIPLAKAIRHSNSKNVQMAVKRCILGLVLLDAILSTVFVGLPGLLIGLLLIPAHWLGKWVYST